MRTFLLFLAFLAGGIAGAAAVVTAIWFTMTSGNPSLLNGDSGEGVFLLGIFIGPFAAMVGFAVGGCVARYCADRCLAKPELRGFEVVMKKSVPP